MSRIGKKAVPTPAGVTVTIDGQTLTVKGPKGQLSWTLPEEIELRQEGAELIVAKRVDTTGCGQGSVFGDLMADVDSIVLPAASITQSQLYGIVNAIRLQDSTYKSAGSVHGCALFKGDELQVFVEDVGRHNAIDTIAGWMWLQGDTPKASGSDKVFYTTGRLTSEMVIKAAQMGVPIVVSRSGITQMGHAVAQSLGLCAIGRATNKRFLCFSGAHRLVLQPELLAPPQRAVA